MTDLSKNIQALREKKAVVEMGGGEAAIEKQIAMGKMTARDRILSDLFLLSHVRTSNRLQKLEPQSGNLGQSLGDELGGRVGYFCSFQEDFQ